MISDYWQVVIELVTVDLVSLWGHPWAVNGGKPAPVTDHQPGRMDHLFGTPGLFGDHPDLFAHHRIRDLVSVERQGKAHPAPEGAQE